MVTDVYEEMVTVAVTDSSGDIRFEWTGHASSIIDALARASLSWEVIVQC